MLSLIHRILDYPLIFDQLSCRTALLRLPLQHLAHEAQEQLPILRLAVAGKSRLSLL